MSWWAYDAQREAPFSMIILGIVTPNCVPGTNNNYVNTTGLLKIEMELGDQNEIILV